MVALELATKKTPFFDKKNDAQILDYIEEF